MEPEHQLARAVETIGPLLLLLALFFWLSHRSRMRERRQNEDWWRRYRENERRTDLQHAWRARFRRYEHESEDEFVARFRSWLYDD